MLKRGMLVALVLWIALAGSTFADPGVATWYGDDFHGRPMANGQIFDMNDPTTAASNSYPMGQWLIVTLRSDPTRQVRVQIRDRGAFTHALDLSKAAFATLASLGTGVIQVEIEVITSGNQPEQVVATPAPAAVPTTTPAFPPDGEGYHIVQPGETFYRIAKNNGTTVEALAALNGLANPDRVNAGQKIYLTAKAREADSPAPVATKPASNEPASSQSTPVSSPVPSTTPTATTPVSVTQPVAPMPTGVISTTPAAAPQTTPAPSPSATPSPTPAPATPARTLISRPAWGGAAVVRSQPATSSQALASVPRGQRVEVVGTANGESINPGEPRWWQVRVDGHVGYVYYILLGESL